MPPADILIVAVGKTELIKGIKLTISVQGIRAGDWVKPGAVVIDCGINVNESKEPGTKSMYGDVDFDGVKKVAGHITPVPGGVGPMTVAMLLRNTFDQAVKHRLNVSVDANIHSTFNRFVK